MRILIAEDNEIIREAYSELLIKSGYLVDSVGSGRDAVSHFDTFNPDLVLMDIEMESHNSGIAAAERILEKAEEAKIVFLTSHDSDDVIVSAMATGAVDYAVKAVDLDLCKRVEKILSGDVQLDSKIQTIVMKEYKRLRENEESLMYFIKNLSSLTPVERELVKLLLQGMKVREIAQYRNVEQVTVKTQIGTLLQKVGARRTKDIVNMIRKLKIEHLFS